MGKRSDFARVPRDLYETPLSAALPLFAHLSPGTRFAEPFAGRGALIDILEAQGHRCVYASDIEPLRDDVHRLDFRDFSIDGLEDVDQVISNCPWKREILHDAIVHLSDQRPTWLLFDADWMHTGQSEPYLPRLRRIVSVGRVKWMPGSPHVGMDNAAWYLFARPDSTTIPTPPLFCGRVKPGPGTESRSR